MAVLLRQPSAGDERAIHAHDTGTTTCMFISKGEQSIDLYVPTTVILAMIPCSRICTRLIIMFLASQVPST